ncbi:hypothetical protein CO731_03988 [Aminobacter sp. MSH1]|uniref:hypothetical protein n=1 Tax=Aminobacter sp. MSH1 TaxID=374606 RepID=UPI000D3905F9|nr:hypothetical protein [Aminobacter sp. MSH1]AWC24500.1 hypothetical protein CO731_03988 [Aminobacter sp. MSH1]
MVDRNMMLPATANRYQPALAVIQAGTYARERVMRKDAQAVGGMKPLGDMAQTAPARPKDMQAINEYYFGISLTPMEVMFSMVERAVDFLNDKLGVGSDGDPKAVEAGNKWREETLIKNVGVGSGDDFRIPKPGENGVTFRAVAKLVLEKFKTEFLAGDGDLRKVLEDAAGFRLDGMNAVDLFKAFADPESDAARKVYDAVLEGLAGQAGSKVSQRLEAATSGAKSVEETLADQKGSSIDVVDKETIAEDLKAVRTAEAKEKLDEAAAIPEKIRDALEEIQAGKDTSGPDSSQAALAIVQALSGMSETVSSPATGQDAPEMELDLSGIARDAAKEDHDEGTKGEALRGLLAQYLEFIDASDIYKKQKLYIRL